MKEYLTLAQIDARMSLYDEVISYFESYQSDADIYPLEREQKPAVIKAIRSMADSWEKRTLSRQPKRRQP